MPTGNLLRNCRWVLQVGAPGQDAHYCEEPVGYTNVRDEDGSMIRKYKHFCIEHEHKAAAQDDDWSE